MRKIQIDQNNSRRKRSLQMVNTLHYLNILSHISISVLSQVKSFLDKIKTNDPSCVNIEEQDDDDEHNEENKSNISEEKKKIQLDLLLFEQDNDTSDSDSDDEADLQI